MSKGYSIKTAAQLSNLTPTTIRTWENRYGLVSPQRSNGNQRLYSDRDIERLQLLARCVEAGYRIGRIAEESNESLISLLKKSGSGGKAEGSPNLKIGLAEAEEAVLGLDGAALEDILVRAIIDHGPLIAVEALITPLMTRLGQGWHEGRYRISHEHLASAVVRTVLGNELRSRQNQQAESVAVVATLPSQAHELGALSAGLAAATAGYRVLYLGTNMPADEIVHAVEESKARVLLISIAFPSATATIRQELDTIRRYIPDHCRLYLGGPSARFFGENEDSILDDSLTTLAETLASSG